ncbi:hypothetical protein H4Q32_029683 [Labeo rohita]|uniref:HAT C-terminal dimerisation domain-containing protein n=1 Tax=Labeo rohita TaxID=84645 RepID=A0ABQ8L854_LABRO|nr:hypothetical protein H4Q32_029683 [Labeo rohita]
MTSKLSASKQAKLPDVMLAATSKRVPQATVDKLVISFPSAVVEQPSFKELITTLQPQAKVISRSTVRGRISDAADDLKKTIITELAKKSYLGVTCHWIEEDSLERRSAELVCNRLRGSHTFDMTASALDDVHCQYKIRDNVVRTTTDSGSNFVKAFHVFGAQNNTDVEENEVDMNEDTEGMNDIYKRLFRSIFAKCQGIWNKTGEVVEDKCELQIIHLVATRWNSACLATERIICITDEKGQDSIRSICDEIKLLIIHILSARLNPAEVVFLREYCITMKPLLKASNIFQSESSVYLGWLLPVIHQLQSKLNRLETSSQTCTPLIRALQNGLQKCFGQMMEDPELGDALKKVFHWIKCAAVLLPKFKTSWTDKPDVIEAALTCVKNHLETTAQENQHQPLSTKLQSPVELDGCLACASDSMDLLHSFPAIKKLSMKLNTALPASAAFERLFSCAGSHLLFTSKRSRIDSVNFENQLLLKLNKRFRR